ncbi:hypothetical protein Ciccas_001221 [Cichlidogyrus casuarinus]|uniref:Long-chain-acyl-CoA dehydrogenase n=1 Tax=Cichlidogyrus casuarinus TaxID=1844966 RepID=A0ABD2QKN3_9PLAT
MNHILRHIHSSSARSGLLFSKRCINMGRLEISQTPTMLDIGNRKIFNEEHDILRESVRKFIQTEIVPHHSKWEEKGMIDRECCYYLGGAVSRLLFINFHRSYANTSGPGFSLHSDIVMPYISHYGTKAQKEKYLPKMTTGEWIGALGMTEPSAGSDLQRIKTTAKSDGKGGYILNGSKVFITNGYHSDVVVVVAITNPEAKSPAHGISLFLVDKSMPGFKKGRVLKKMGLKAQDTAELFFEDVKLGKEHLLGEENKGFYYLMQELPRERLLIGVISQCGAEFVFEETRKYVKERKAFKSTLSHLQTIQHKLAEMKTEICVSRSFIDTCLMLLNENKLDNEMASMAKYYASDLWSKIANTGVQLHGGWGYMWEYPVCKSYVDARVQSIYGGSNEIMKELIARVITKN